MSASTLSDQLHRSSYRHGHRVRGVRVIGIDEVSYHKRHKYATLVYDLERSVVVWVGQGRGRATIDQFFDHQLSGYQKSQIHTGCCDMSEAYMGAITTHCPNARLVLDRFHQRRHSKFERNNGAKPAPRTERPSRDCVGCCTGIHPLAHAVTRRLSGRWRNTTGESIARGDSRTSSNSCGTSTPRGRHCDSSTDGPPPPCVAASNHCANSSPPYAATRQVSSPSLKPE